MKIDNTQARTINLRLAEVDDADFIYSLRTQSDLTKHLSTINGDVNDQRKWLTNYKEREKKGIEYYFIISRVDNHERVGTVRLYDFIAAKNSFCWGSWILNHNKTRSAAIESALLVYKIGFETLDFSQSHFDVRKDNIKVIDFHKKLGAYEVGEDDNSLIFEYQKSTFESIKSNFEKYLVK